MNSNEQMALAIIDDMTRHNPQLRHVLWTHSRAVADMALACAAAHTMHIDTDLLEQAALLHDVGIVYTDAPSIFCHGELPYICHGLAGANELRRRGLPLHARVCETHTGAGLTAADIEAQNLPLPHRDMLPLTDIELLVCYADKFFSKSGHLDTPKPLDKVRRSMAVHGADTLERFEQMHARFALEDHYRS